MIEMLGVLAIIGVLSVGGIAGYSKAMMKYKINKFVDHATTIATNTRALFAPQKNYKGINDTIIKKAHLFPDEVYTGSGISDYENVFGGTIGLSTSNKTPITGGKSDDKAFYIYFDGIPEEACMELATMDWGSGSSSGLIAISPSAGATADTIGCSGEKDTYTACPNGSVLSIPMPVSEAAKACTGNNNEFTLKYY